MASILNFTRSLLEFERFSDPLIGKLVAHRDQLIVEKGEPYIHVPVLPQIIKVNAIRMQAFVREAAGRVIGLNPILYFCVIEGYTFFKNNPFIISLTNYRAKFDRCSTEVDGELSYAMDNLMGSFKVKLPMEGKRKIFPVSSKVHSDVSSLASGIGITISDLSCLCIMHTLVEIHGTITPHIEEMQGVINTSLKRAEIRSKVLEAVFEKFDL